MEERQSLLIFDSSYDRLMSESMDALGNTQITNKGPGGIVRLLLGIVNQSVSNFYGTLKVEQAQAFLSKAKGNNVDLIGEALSCKRTDGESDDAYKFRISNQTLSLERANETAVRLAALSVPGVVDVIMRPFTHGTGSFSIYPIMDDPYDPDTEQTIRAMAEAVDSVKALGVRASVLSPSLAFVELKGRISFARQLSDMDRMLIQDRATQSVRTHVNALLPGDAIRINQLHRLVMEQDSSIADVEFYHFTVNGRAMLLIDQVPAWNTRFVESETLSPIAFT